MAFRTIEQLRTILEQECAYSLLLYARSHYQLLIRVKAIHDPASIPQVVFCEGVHTISGTVNWFGKAEIGSRTDLRSILRLSDAFATIPDDYLLPLFTLLKIKHHNQLTMQIVARSITLLSYSEAASNNTWPFSLLDFSSY